MGGIEKQVAGTIGMPNPTVINNIIRVEGSSRFDAEDAQIKECPVSLMLEGAELTNAVITARDNDAKELWALGYLKCGGFIGKIDDVADIEIGENSVNVGIKNELVKRVRDEPLKVTWRTNAGVIFCAAHRLGDAPLYRATGGTHAAAVFYPNGELLFEAEDIGRHNAVDKVVGWALRENIDFSGVLLITSGRMPKDMVTKVWSAGICLMAGVSAASADGIDTAKLANMTLAGFVRGERMNVYTDSVPCRIVT